jgi:hypothetical protein
MAVYYTLQIADIWTTQRGMDYECVYEQNPLLPRVPSTERLILHKVVFTSPVWILDKENLLKKGDVIFPTMLMTYVIHHNLKVIDRASKRCNKR